MTSPLNASPQAIALGIEDLSTAALVAEAEQLPTHLPKIYIYAKQGPITPQLVVGNSRSIMYGVDSFDLTLPWANHATVLANLVNDKGNAAMYQRLVPADAPAPASIRCYIDVLPTLVPKWLRNSDGSIKVDNTNTPLQDGVLTIAGHSVKYIVEVIALDPTDQSSTFGLAEQRPGTQTDPLTQTQSIQYPLFDAAVPDFGSYGNLNGLRLWAPTSKSSTPIDTTLLVQNKVYPFRMACMVKPDADTSAKIWPTQAAEQYVDISFVPGTINKRVKKVTFVEDVFVPSYQNLQDPVLPPMWGPFGKFHLYQSELDALVQEFYTAEQPYIIGSADFTGEPGEQNRFNFIGGTDSNGIPYQSFVFSKDTDGVRFTENSTVYASGGGDGTMNDVEFGKLASVELLQYADPNSELQDTAKYPESFFWDSGFPLQTKYDAISIISQRKDTGIGLTPFSTTGAQLTASEESALAVALRSRLAMFPESDYFGTAIVRGIIVGRSGTLINSQYTKPLPLILEIASKAADYMGAGSGTWKAGKSFDRAGSSTAGTAQTGSKITMFQDINVTFTPATVRNKDWANGLNWVQSFDRRTFFAPALKTAYDDDTSVLTSFFTMMGAIEVEKVGDRCWRSFTGVDTLTNAQIIKEVNAFFNDNLAGRFDNRFTIVPEAYFSAADVARGYSYAVRVKLYAANMKTVQTMSIQARRIEDLTL